jgi:pantoate--beta-alanine ligase
VGKIIDTVETVSGLRKKVTAWRRSSEKVVLVPTMGALHEGHLSLVETAKNVGDRTVVSIFVNPTQFAPNEDFDSYPRDHQRDLQKLAALDVDLVFMPARSEVYPDDFSTRVIVSGLSEGLCGASRPHFFGGVATVVAKLFNQCRPDAAIFGEKDYQQLLVIRRMARDLDMNVEVLGGSIVREADGVAMSSRNAYLSADERAKAPELFRTISNMADNLARGAAIGTQIEAGRTRLEEAGFRVDYLEVRDGETLSPVTRSARPPARVFGAAFLGKTRLIDNVPVPALS